MMYTMSSVINNAAIPVVGLWTLCSINLNNKANARFAVKPNIQKVTTRGISPLKSRARKQVLSVDAALAWFAFILGIRVI